MNTFEPDIGSTLVIGRGFNSLTLDEMAVGIADSDLIQPMGAAGQTVTYELRQIEDISTLRKSLNLSASASLAGSFGSGSLKAKFFNSVNFNSYSFFLYIHVRVANANRALKNYRLTDEAVEYIKGYGGNSFLEVYGDEFVSSYTTGGELIAIVQINNRTVQEKTEREAELQGKYGSFSSSAEFGEAIETLDVKNATEVYVMRRGGSGNVPDISNLKTAALEFPNMLTEASGNSVLLQVRTVPYVLASNRPDNISLVNLEPQRLDLERVALQREEAVVARADYQFAATHPYYFYQPDVNLLNVAIADCSAAVTRIDAAVQACLLGGGRIFIDPKVAVPKLPLDWTIPLDVPLAVMAHVEGHGDTWVGAHQFAGTRGENRRIEGISIAVNPPLPGLYIEYFAHIEGIGDTPWTRDGAYCGTRGQSRRLEGFQIRLIGPLALIYDVIYMGHIEGTGDVQVQNDQFCGTRGQNRRCEGIQVAVVRRR